MQEGIQAKIKSLNSRNLRLFIIVISMVTPITYFSPLFFKVVSHWVSWKQYAPLRSPWFSMVNIVNSRIPSHSLLIPLQMNCFLSACSMLGAEAQECLTFLQGSNLITLFYDCFSQLKFIKQIHAEVQKMYFKIRILKKIVKTIGYFKLWTPFVYLVVSIFTNSEQKAWGRNIKAREKVFLEGSPYWAPPTHLSKSVRVRRKRKWAHRLFAVA